MLEEKEEQDGLLAKLQQDLKDKDVENRIAGKKGDQLVSEMLLPDLKFLLWYYMLILYFIWYATGSQLWLSPFIISEEISYLLIFVRFLDIVFILVSSFVGSI